MGLKITALFTTTPPRIAILLVCTVWLFHTALYGNDARRLLFTWMLSLGAACLLMFHFEVPIFGAFLLAVPYGLLLVYLMNKINVRCAKSLVDTRLRLYESPFEVVKIAPCDFPWLDMNFYETATSRLSTLGFHKVKDVESLHQSRANPEARYFTRTFLSADGMTWCNVSQQRYSQPKNRAEKNSNISNISFGSELSDGTYLVTGNLKGVMLQREITGIVSQEFPPDMPLEKLFQQHEALIQRTLTEGNLHLVPYEAEEGGRRAFELLREDIRKYGFFTDAELQQLAEMNGHTKHFLEFPMTKKMHELSEKLSREMFQEFGPAPKKLNDDT